MTGWFPCRRCFGGLLFERRALRWRSQGGKFRTRNLAGKKWETVSFPPAPIQVLDNVEDAGGYHDKNCYFIPRSRSRVQESFAAMLTPTKLFRRPCLSGAHASNRACSAPSGCWMTTPPPAHLRRQAASERRPLYFVVPRALFCRPQLSFATISSPKNILVARVRRKSTPLSNTFSASTGRGL